jgi:hypothetical protein
MKALLRLYYGSIKTLFWFGGAWAQVNVHEVTFVFMLQLLSRWKSLFLKRSGTQTSYPLHDDFVFLDPAAPPGVKAYICLCVCVCVCVCVYVYTYIYV